MGVNSGKENNVGIKEGKKKASKTLGHHSTLEDLNACPFTLPIKT